ncbi:MAG: tRNA epoxyqueuosine(34) reductase QueG, partial [Thiomonas sp. 15-63-373]
GSPIRRIGFERWQRNLAVALGNGLRGNHETAWRQAATQALHSALPRARALLQEHVRWALAQAETDPGEITR